MKNLLIVKHAPACRRALVQQAASVTQRCQHRVRLQTALLDEAQESRRTAGLLRSSQSAALKSHRLDAASNSPRAPSMADSALQLHRTPDALNDPTTTGHAASRTRASRSARLQSASVEVGCVSSRVSKCVERIDRAIEWSRLVGVGYTLTGDKRSSI